jgi:hypothetical protein
VKNETQFVNLFTKKFMIKPLRKRHLQIWALWAVLIPVGIIAAWMAVPKKVEQELLQPPASKTSAFQIKTVDTLKSK